MHRPRRRRHRHRPVGLEQPDHRQLGARHRLRRGLREDPRHLPVGRGRHRGRQHLVRDLGTGILFNHDSGGATIANNLSFNNGNHGISVDARDGSGDNFVITNNIVLDNAMYGINVHSSANGAHNQYRNNLLRNNKKGGFGLDNSKTPAWSTTAPTAPATIT